MTALTEDKSIQRTEGVQLAFPVAASEDIYGGALTCVNAAGYALEGSDTAGLIFEGVAMERKNNSSGSNGDLDVVLHRRGLFNVILDTAITQANVGDNVFLVDDQTVDLTANVSNNILCGIIAKYIDTTHAWIDIEPAIRQADVATHIADGSAAHAASAVSIADSGSFTSQTEAEAALQEIYQDLISAQQIIAVPLTAFLKEDGTILTKFTAGATPGFQQLSDKEVVLTWDGNATPGAASVVIPLVDPRLDPTADVIVHFLAKMAAAADTPVVVFEAFIGAGDTDCAGTDPEVDQGATLTEYTMTIAAADVPAAPSSLTLVLTPTAGQMDTDELHLYAIWLEVTSKLRAS